MDYLLPNVNTLSEIRKIRIEHPTIKIIIVGIILVGLIVYLVSRNAKDEKEFEQQQNNDYHKTKDEEGDVDTEERIK